MAITPLARVLCACALSLASVSANAAVVRWTPTDGDVNYSYTLATGNSLAMFDLDDFDGSKSSPLLVNNGLNTGVDTIDIVSLQLAPTLLPQVLSVPVQSPCSTMISL